jgi:hypothetical protein
MSMKKLVLSQTCQGNALQELLLLSKSFRAEYTCLFVPNYEIVDGKAVAASSQELEAQLEDCDTLIYHDVGQYDFERLLERLPSGALAIKIPYVTSAIYWPTYDFFHPCWLVPHGVTALIPWPCTVLNALITTERDKQRAMRRYLDMDLTTQVDFEANFASQIVYLRKAEAGTIFRVADLVEEQYASTQLFYLINHPSAPIFLHIANSILGYLGFPPLNVHNYDPFCMHQIPIHPSVAAHYGLTWCPPERKYFMIDREMKFDEYVCLYIDSYVEKYGYSISSPPARKFKWLQRLKGVITGGSA